MCMIRTQFYPVIHMNKRIALVKNLNRCREYLLCFQERGSAFHVYKAAVKFIGSELYFLRLIVEAGVICMICKKLMKI